MSVELINTVQEQSVGEELILLFELYLDEDSSPPSVVYFYPGFNTGDGVQGEFGPGDRDYAGEVQFKTKEDPAVANKYFPLPVEVTGVEMQSDGPQGRPTMVVANILDHFSEALGNLTNESLIGKKLKIRRTLKKYLISPVGETTLVDGNPVVEFPTRTFIIDRIAEQNYITVTFELASPFDLANIQIPNRAVVGKYCSWVYQGLDFPTPRGGCSWRLDSLVKTVDANGNEFEYNYYFNSKNEPLVDGSLASQFSLFNSSTQYSTSEAVSIDNDGITEYYFCNTSQTSAGESPLSNPALWQRVHLYTIWNPGVSYQANPDKPFSSDYVLYTDTQGSGDFSMWRCARSHTSEPNRVPGPNSAYWIRGDECGKTIQSCKIRFQAKNNFGIGNGSGPLMEYNSSIPLPFGGYPGTAKFR